MRARCGWDASSVAGVLGAQEQHAERGAVDAPACEADHSPWRAGLFS
jgi:hypothetical protein